MQETITSSSILASYFGYPDHNFPDPLLGGEIPNALLIRIRRSYDLSVHEYDLLNHTIYYATSRKTLSRDWYGYWPSYTVYMWLLHNDPAFKMYHENCPVRDPDDDSRVVHVSRSKSGQTVVYTEKYTYWGDDSMERIDH